MYQAKFEWVPNPTQSNVPTARFSNCRPKLTVASGGGITQDYAALPGQSSITAMHENDTKRPPFGLRKNYIIIIRKRLLEFY